MANLTYDNNYNGVNKDILNPNIYRNEKSYTHIDEPIQPDKLSLPSTNFVSWINFIKFQMINDFGYDNLKGYIGGDWEDVVNRINDLFNNLNNRIKTLESYHQEQPVTQYTVSFNVNGGSGSISSQTVNAGSSIILPSYNGTKPGYTFEGWNTNSTGTGTNYNAGASYIVNNNITLYAKWEAAPVTTYKYFKGKIDFSKSEHNITEDQINISINEPYTGILNVHAQESNDNPLWTIELFVYPKSWGTPFIEDDEGEEAWWEDPVDITVPENYTYIWAHTNESDQEFNLKYWNSN